MASKFILTSQRSWPFLREVNGIKLALKTRLCICSGEDMNVLLYSNKSTPVPLMTHLQSLFPSFWSLWTSSFPVYLKAKKYIPLHYAIRTSTTLNCAIIQRSTYPPLYRFLLHNLPSAGTPNSSSSSARS